MVQTPLTPETQQYLQDVACVLAIVTEIVGDEKRATLLLHSAPLGTFGNKTADALIQEGAPKRSSPIWNQSQAAM